MSILTEGVSQASAPVAPPPSDGTAEQAIQQAVDGPPEWVPPKFWDPEKKAPRVEDLGKGYLNLEKLLSRDKVPVPLSDEDEEGWSRWYAASGRPEKPDDYEWERPSLPEDLPYDEDIEKAFRMSAHINGLSKKQAKNLYETYVKTRVEQYGAHSTGMKQARAEIERNMQREYGDKYEAKVNIAQLALKEHADEDYLRYLDETGQGNDPRVIRAWIRVGERMVGETKLKGKPEPQAQPADLDKAIADFRSKYQKQLFDRNHPDHDIRVKEYNKLFEARFGQ